MATSIFGYIPKYSDLSAADLRNLGYVPGYTVVSTKSGATTLTAAEMLGGMILMDPAGGAANLTTPTAALVIAAMNDPKAGDAFILHARNTADLAEAITLVGGSGVTVSGTDTIAQNNAKSFLCVVTNAASGSEAITAYSLGTVVW